MRNPLLVSALVALAALLAGGSCQPPPPLAPQPGRLEYQQGLFVPVPGGAVNAAGNNLQVTREDLSLDTRIGGYSLGAVYDSAAPGWHWSFEMTYDGTTLVDAGGARLATAGLAPGDAIPGTWWVVLGPDAVKTKGGLVHRFGPDGRLASVHWSSDPYPRIETRSQSVAGAPRITELTQCRHAGDCSWLVRVDYDAAGRPVELKDRAGRRAEFAWDAEGRLVAARDALDVARGWPGFRYEYTGERLSALTNSEGERVEFASSGRVLEVRALGEENPTWRFERKPPEGGRYRTRVTDPLGAVRTFEYDASRRLLVARDPLGDEVVWEWQGRRPVSRSGPAGLTTGWLLDGDDVVGELQPGGRLVQIEYAPEAVNRAAPRRRAPARLSDDLGVLEERSYDAAGRLVARRDGAGDTTTLAYGADGQLVQVTRADGSTLGFADYGDHGHPETLIVDGTSWPRTFDAVGNLLERAAVEPDQPGVLARGFDEDRNVTSVTLSHQVQGVPYLADVVLIERRSDGRRLAVTRPGPAAEYVYDALGRLVERRDRRDGAWRSTRFEWDAAGRLSAWERPNTMREERAYDAAGRPVLRVFGRGEPFVPETAAAFAWEQGRLVEVWDGVHGAPERYAWDAAGRLARVTYPQGETLTPGWDGRGRVVSLDLEAAPGFAARLEVAYDGAGRETSLRVDGALVQERVFAAGRLVETRHGNGLVRSVTRTAPLESSSETRDAAGALVARTRLAEAEPGNALLCVDLEMESFVGAGAALSERHCLGGARRISDGSESWDALGNPLAWAGEPRSYGPDQALLLEAEGRSYAWDEAGFATGRDGAVLAYDAAGRPTQVGPEHALAWDALGRPVSESTPVGTTGRRFGGWVEADASGAPRALDLGAVRLDLVGDDHVHRHFDPRGNVAFTSDAAGAVRSVYRYGAFGPVEVVGAADDPLRFARGRQLGELVLLGHRLLDPAVGRFLSPDPVYQLQSQYTYAWGDPLFFWDPSGWEGTLHGFTARQLAAAFGFAGAGVALYGAIAGPGVIVIPAASALASTWLSAIDSVGGFPWEGDRKLWEVLGIAPAEGAPQPPADPGGGAGRAPSGVPGELDLLNVPIAGVPNVQDTFHPPGEPGSGDGSRLRLPDGSYIRVCAPTRVGPGSRSAVAWTLICVNLLLGAVLLRRERTLRR